MRVRRQRTTRRRGSSSPSPLLLGTGALAILIAFALLFVAFKAPTGIPLKPYYDVNVQFTSLGTLSEGANVSIAGKYVGEAVDMRLVHGVPTVKLELDTSTQKLPIDTSARIRPRGLLGAEYVDLVPGHSTQTIANGGTLSIKHTSEAVQLSDLNAAFNPHTRTNLGNMLRGLGEGVLGRGPQLNDAIGVLPGTLRNLTAALGPLVSADSMPRLIAGSEALSADIDPVKQIMVQGFAQGSKALEPFAQEQGSITQLLDESPSDLGQIQRSLATTDTVLGHVTRFAKATTRFTSLAPRALHSLTAVLVKGRAPLRDAGPLLKQVKAAVPPTLRFTHALNPELPYLTRLFRTLGPPLVTLGPYGCDFDGFANNWRGFFGIGSNLQHGPYGPYTSLRLELAGIGSTPDNDISPGGGQSDSQGPCAPGST